MVRLLWLGCLLTVMIAGCSNWGSDDNSAEPDDPLPALQALTNLDCAQVSAHMDSEVTCIKVPPDGLLLQTLDRTQSTFQATGISLTFDSTVYWATVADEEMVIAAIEGISVVGAGGMTHILHPGTQVSLSLDEGLAISLIVPAVLEPYDRDKVARAPLDDLPHEVDLPAPIVSIEQPTVEATTATTPETTETPTPVSDECVVREDWGYFYTVQLGDNLSRIARRHDVSVTELQEGNCLTDPNRIREGQVLRVPSGSASTIAVTATPGAVFYAANTHLRPGACTTLYWEATEAGVVYLGDSPVAQDSSTEVCPKVTTTYTLRVYYMSGAQRDYTVTLIMEGNR
jgi:hypothetical protein